MTEYHGPGSDSVETNSNLVAENMSVVLLLLFPMKAALATSSVYVVTGISSFFDGIYEEKREPELHYKKVGEADSGGNYDFLYTDSRRPQTWILGEGKTFSATWAKVRAPAIAGRPVVTQWSYVGNGRREGKEEGIPLPHIRVVGVETNITGEELEKRIDRWEDIVTEEYIICRDHQSELQIILRNSNDAAYCNAFADCESGLSLIHI